MTMCAPIISLLTVPQKFNTSCFMYCFYVASFTVIAFLWSPPFPPLAYVAAITGSVIGGCGAGFLWTAQGAYLTLSAHAIAQTSQEDVADVTARLASGTADSQPSCCSPARLFPPRVLCIIF